MTSTTHAIPAPGSLPRVLWELSKAPLSLMVVLTAAVGYVLGANGPLDVSVLGCVLAGVGLAAGGANAFNEVIERGPDGRMRRTAGRPLPSGRMGAAEAWLAAWAMTLGGGAILLIGAGWLPAAMALGNAALYAGVYTPLKRRSPFCTLVGAVVGAVAPMIGWAAAAGRIEAGAWALAAVLFTWQIPHFLALGWIHREDYARAGFRMLPMADPAGRLTFALILLYTLALLPATLSAAMFGVAGALYAVGAALLGSAMAALSARLSLVRTRDGARAVFLASLIYLPLLLGLMILDRIP